MRIAGIVQDSIVDGQGLRFVVFVQGCNFGCEGCHNPDSLDPSGGKEISTSKIIALMLKNPLTDGLTLSGGEPFLQVEECIEIAKAAQSNGLNVWIFTGYTFEELIVNSQRDNKIIELLELTDILVDGPYLMSERTLSLKWRGSKNQRIIDVKKSLKNGGIEEID